MPAREALTWSMVFGAAGRGDGVTLPDAAGRDGAAPAGRGVYVVTPFADFTAGVSAGAGVELWLPGVYVVAPGFVAGSDAGRGDEGFDEGAELVRGV
jgi:hypothetical protein